MPERDSHKLYAARWHLDRHYGLGFALERKNAYTKMRQLGFVWNSVFGWWEKSNACELNKRGMTA